LERGDDDAGRPLLERALAIQEAALGPDHPDVAAIRDVLASDE
jgi:centrosomal protein CEP104